MRKYWLFLFMGMTLLSGCGDLTGSGSSGGGSASIPSNLKKTSFNSVPGWYNDDHRYALQAFRNTCKARIQYSGRVIPSRKLLEDKCRMLPRESISANAARTWFENNFQPYKVYDNSGKGEGTYTGYYSPVIAACKKKTAQCNEPLMNVPTDGRNYKGVSKERIVENKIGRVLYWANIVDVQNIQIQGSGMLKLEDGSLVKLNFAGVNDLPFKSIGDQLKRKGIKPSGGYSSEAVWSYLRKHESLAREIIYKNPRYVYFQVAKSHNVIGKLGTPLSKIRSVAMDDSLYTLGLPVFINTNLSVDGRKFQRLMIAQDTGSAIRGWIRADIFFGSGDEAYKYAHGQHSQGEMYILMPKTYGN